QLYIAGISYLALHNDFDRSEQEGLILMNRNFDYLPDPFPNVPVKYFQKWIDAYELPGDGAQTVEAEMVIKLNEKLHRFHKKALRKLKKKG
ncbi:MAG: hypothetical protein KDC44_07260, partial [Phaeodactylibacter sp.]|nr:hypothetical protein [Phaeodactylibacter sp.]